MDKCTHDVRSARWKKVILDCQQRSAGTSVKQWLDENDILEQSYYYWQRKFRNVAYDQMEKASLPSLQAPHNEVSFIEIATPVHKEAPVECNLEVIKPTAVIKTATMSIAISNDISEQLLSRILLVVSHA